MKSLTVLAAVITASVAAFGQGQVFFYNRANVGLPNQVVAPIYGVNPAAPQFRRSGNATTNGGTIDYTGIPTLMGTGFTAQLWAASGVNNDMNSAGWQGLNPTTTFRTTSTGGGFFPATQSTISYVLPFVTAQTPTASFQVRVWDNNGGTVTSWAAVLANPNLSGVGFSDIFQVNPPLIPNVPIDLIGLRSFNLVGRPVPEPSSWALLALGAAFLFITRRRRARKLCR